MHKDDQMTPKERMAAFFSGGEMDRLPAMPFFISVAGPITGMTHREKRSTAQGQARSQIETYKKMGHDGISMEYGLHAIGRACGAGMSDPEDSVPAIIDPVMKTIDDVDKLEIEKVYKENDPYIRLYLEATEICNEEIGDEIGAGISMPGPMTAANSLYPVEKLLRAMRREPEKVHKLLRFCTEAIKYAVSEFNKVEGSTTLCDPIASCNIMSEKEYMEFVYPYTVEINNYIHELGAGVGYHICGNTCPITVDMVDTGCDMLSIDTMVPLKFAKEKVGSRVPLIGNIDPNQTLMLGKPDDIWAEMKQNLADAYDSPKGYIISSGCDIPRDTPVENCYAFMEAARELGSWPLDPDKFVE